jgi:hypothetical protein
VSFGVGVLQRLNLTSRCNRWAKIRRSIPPPARADQWMRGSSPRMTASLMAGNNATPVTGEVEIES